MILLVVPCHAVFLKGCTGPDKAAMDASRTGGYPGEGQCYIGHASAGVLRAADNDESVLLFSGGQTQEAAGQRSEAESYWEIARDHGWWDQPQVESRTFTEPAARDSLENVLFSLARFRQLAVSWPERIVVLGWQFKAQRFELIRRALKWPAAAFEYVGVNDPGPDALAAATAGEQQTLQSMKNDIYCAGQEFASKRALRDPFQTGNPYRGVDPVLDSVFDFMNRNAYTGRIPWLGRL